MVLVRVGARFRGSLDSVFELGFIRYRVMNELGLRVGTV